MGPKVTEKMLLELKGSDWYLDLPPVIKQAIDLCPPGVYRLKTTGQLCMVIGYNEYECDNPEHVTMIVEPLTASRHPLFNGASISGIPMQDLIPENELKQWK